MPGKESVETSVKMRKKEREGEGETDTSLGERDVNQEKKRLEDSDELERKFRKFSILLTISMFDFDTSPHPIF